MKMEGFARRGGGATHFDETSDPGPHAVIRQLAPSSLVHYRPLVGAAAEQIDCYRDQSAISSVSTSAPVIGCSDWADLHDSKYSPRPKALLRVAHARASGRGSDLEEIRTLVWTRAYECHGRFWCLGRAVFFAEEGD